MSSQHKGGSEERSWILWLVKY